MKQNKNGVWLSWNENLTYNYESLYTIETEQELQQVVSNADKIRFFGTKQSSADIAAGVDNLIDLEYAIYFTAIRGCDWLKRLGHSIINNNYIFILTEARDDYEES